MTVRMNFGSGSVQPDGWVNVDKIWQPNEPDNDRGEDEFPPIPGFYHLDPVEHRELDDYDGRAAFPAQWSDTFDYIVANHSLSDLTHHELPAALAELHRVLKPGGVLRVLVPDLLEAMRAWHERHEGWFPQDERTGDLSAKFCTFVTWYGTVGSVFVPSYLHSLLKASFDEVTMVGPGITVCDDPEITSLDGDRTTALIMEGRKT